MEETTSPPDDLRANRDLTNPGRKPPVEKVALHVNLAPDVAEALQELVSRRNSNLTEEVRLAISAWKWIYEQTKAGNQILVKEKGQPPREIQFLHAGP